MVSRMVACIKPMSYEAIAKREVRFQAFLIRRRLTLRRKSRLSSSHVATFLQILSG